DSHHLLEIRELGELRHELGVVHGLERVLVLHLRDEELQERLLVEALVVAELLRQLLGVESRACGRYGPYRHAALLSAHELDAVGIVLVEIGSGARIACLAVEEPFAMMVCGSLSKRGARSATHEDAEREDSEPGGPQCAQECLPLGVDRTRG